MTPREELIQVLDCEHADEVIKHRQRLRKPLTAYAAKLLAKTLAKCHDANAAADMMIENGWQTCKPEWFAKRSQSSERGFAGAEDDLRRRIDEYYGSDGRRGGDFGNAQMLPLLSYDEVH